MLLRITKHINLTKNIKLDIDNKNKKEVDDGRNCKI